ncbi:hypothetical protein O3P69_020963 [Scylla paramamosain]|uniref:Uncharacterized protein n=1 Tax=Scylla paramamosain TaxID=85552 RepID=A0AAW0SF20_SCYPA
MEQKHDTLSIPTRTRTLNGMIPSQTRFSRLRRYRWVWSRFGPCKDLVNFCKEQNILLAKASVLVYRFTTGVKDIVSALRLDELPSDDVAYDPLANSLACSETAANRGAFVHLSAHGNLFGCTDITRLARKAIEIHEANSVTKDKLKTILDNIKMRKCKDLINFCKEQNILLANASGTAYRFATGVKDIVSALRLDELLSDDVAYDFHAFVNSRSETEEANEAEKSSSFLSISETQTKMMNMSPCGKYVIPPVTKMVVKIEDGDVDAAIRHEERMRRS